MLDGNWKPFLISIMYIYICIIIKTPLFMILLRSVGPGI